MNISIILTSGAVGMLSFPGWSCSHCSDKMQTTTSSLQQKRQKFQSEQENTKRFWSPLGAPDPIVEGGPKYDAADERQPLSNVHSRSFASPGSQRLHLEPVWPAVSGPLMLTGATRTRRSLQNDGVLCYSKSHFHGPMNRTFLTIGFDHQL